MLQTVHTVPCCSNKKQPRITPTLKTAVCEKLKVILVIGFHFSKHQTVHNFENHPGHSRQFLQKLRVKLQVVNTKFKVIAL